jgi:hypothetical protein
MASTCADQVGTCAYYMCLANELGCGDDGRLKALAFPYCRKYEDERSEFSPNGQRFLREVKLCLQLNVDRSAPVSCESADEAFVRAHVDCYVDKGFCDLSLVDELRLGSVAWPAIRDPAFRNALTEIKWQCRLRKSFASARR